LPDPCKDPAVFLQVALAIHEDNPGDAMKSLQSVLEQNPYSKGPIIAFCNILLAKIAVNQREYDLAQKAVENAVEIWRDEPGWHSLAAQIYKRNYDVTGAINHLSHKTYSQNITYIELGKVYFDNANDDTRMLKQAYKSLKPLLE
jgi:tetratricopeptide (TPR) repeat protein